MKHMLDLIVVGLGIMGAATLWRAAPKCTSVLGIDASGPTHRYGSSQGGSRIFRRAYWEGEKYLPLLNHANLLWHELEKQIGHQILFDTGGVFIGPTSSSVVAGSIKTAIQGNIEHEIWTSSTARARLPAFDFRNNIRVVYEPGAYAISASDARLGMLNEAVRQGAMIEFGDSVVKIENHDAGIRLTTKNGRTHHAKSIALTTGPWINNNFLPELNNRIEPRRIPVYWFKPNMGFEKLFSKEHFPVFLYERNDGAILYGVPSIISNEPGVKIGFHNRQQDPAIPDWKNVPVQQQYIAEISDVVKTLFPKLEHLPAQAKNCFYTMSQDESFLIGNSKTLTATYFASACSGHGYKFAPSIGDALANMAVGQQPCLSLSEFSSDRFNIA